MDAASEVVTVPVSDATVTVTQKSTDSFNVNQSNNNTHTQTITHTGNNSLLSKIASNVISNNSGSSLNIGGSSNSNSSCSSSSTSSNSSGYGSSTTTPTNNYDLQNTTPTTTPIPTTTVANTEHIIPVATVAAVTPFFNEAITTHNLGTQHHHHHAQQSQEQLQQQQHHMLPAPHHQQYSQNHLQANLQHQQHHQYLSRQQYYSPYDYQQPAPTHNLSVPSPTPTVAPYNMVLPGPYEMTSSNVAPAFGTSQYKSSTVGSTYERSPLAKTNAAACVQQPQPQHIEQQQSKTTNQHFSGLLGSTKARSTSSFISNSTSTNTSKPQATATPFYTNPMTFYDNYKHKIPLEYPDAYGNTPSATAATYHQQQKYYAAAKSQLKEASYGAPAGLNSKSAYANTSNIFPGSTGGLNLSSASYDKYMYPHVPTAGYAATGHLGNETPPEVSNYRKPIMASNMNSPSWPWGIEYASGNSRSIPPPASHIPTATVAPTHATHLTQNSSVLARDPFYVTHDKYVGKYDKYSTSSYPQTYVSQPTSRHMWSNTPHASNLTQFNDRHLLAPGPPALPAHGPHTASYFPNNHNASLNSRQTCCSQPYQSQSCYYPVSHPVQPRLAHNQSNTVAPPPSAACLPGQQPLGQSPHLSALTASCKYSGVFPDYGNANKIKTSNDLYLNSHHYDINPPLHNFGYATAHNSQQLYNTNAHQSMSHAATPSSLLTNDPFNANPTSYTNDLNLTTSNFDNYYSHIDSHPSQQTLTAIHNTQPPPAYGPTVAKRALLDYRKPIQPQPPPTIPEDCYPSLTPRDHYNQHELLNTPETTTTFEEYERHQSSVTEQSAEALNDSVAGAEESNKNLSLRDFIANWNDDEDEFQNNEEINFDQTAVINEVLQTAPVETEAAATVVTIQEVKVIKPATQQNNDAEIPKELLKTAEEQSVLLSETEASQYVNLPDIVIDVKKSNNVNNSITTPTTSPIPSPTQVVDTGNSLNLTDFDVEKELDELNLKKPLQQEQTKEINDIKDSKSVNTPQLSPSRNINSHQLIFEDFSLEPTTKTVLNAITTTRLTTTNQGSESNEQYLKDIEGYESSCSRHSNESAFEKEYETFINKITSESSCPTKKGEQKLTETEKDIDFDKNVQDFSKFYKRKRKLKEDGGLKNSTTANQNKKKIKTVEATTVNNSNFPQVYTKKCRNRLLKTKHGRTHKRKPISTFYKIIYFIRHQRLQREKRVREFMLELKDKHLPLIKRQSIKNYTPAASQSLLTPKTLKALCIMVFNTEEFRQSLFPAKDQQQDTCLETEEKHICTDPTCETCEVIKSLMETENFEATLLQQTTEPTTTVYCTEVTKEAITILDDIPNTNDLSFRNEETIIISSSIEDNQYIQENLSELITKSVLSENLVLDEQSDNFPIMMEQNIHAKDEAEIVLQAVFDSFETNFSEAANTAEAEAQVIESQTELSPKNVKQALSNTKTNPITQDIDESKVNTTHTLMETALHENLELKPLPDKPTTYCDIKKSDEFDKVVAETLSRDNTYPVQKINVSEERPESKTSRVEKHSKENSPAKINISPPLKTKRNEESDTEDSNSSDSESESSSSATEDKSTAHSYEKRFSSSESSDTDTESDLEEHETCNLNLNSQHSKEEESKQTDDKEIQNEKSDSTERKPEQNSCSPQLQTGVSAKIMLDDEKIPSSPQRIVIRITKCLSPNEQSLRVENISAKPLKIQNEYDDHTESADHTDDEDIKEKKTDFLSRQQEDFVSKNTFEKQTDSDHAEDCNTEKKLVTPLKLVLRGKEYLRVKSKKKSLKVQSKSDNNTESESENEEFLKQKSKTGKDTKKRRSKGKEVSDTNSDKGLKSLKSKSEKAEKPFVEIGELEKFEVNLDYCKKNANKEDLMGVKVSEICEPADKKEQGNEDIADITLATNSGPSPASMIEELEEITTPIKKLLSEEHEPVTVEHTKAYLFDNNSEEEDNNSLPPFVLSGPSPHSSNADIAKEDHNQRNSSPVEDSFNNDASHHDMFHDVEEEKSSYFATFSENQSHVGIENMKTSSSIEDIETYNLTDSEEEKEIYSLSDSESCNSSEYDSYDDESSEPTNFSISNPIVISDDDSLENAAVYTESRAQLPRKVSKDEESELSQKSVVVDIIKDNHEYSKSPIELLELNVLKNNDAAKTEMNRSEQDFSDYSYTSEEDSNEEIISESKTETSLEEEERCLFDSSSVKPKQKESCIKVFPEIPEKSLPAESLDEEINKGSALEQLISKTRSQPFIGSNSEKEKSECLLVLEEQETEKAIPLAEEKVYFKVSEQTTNQSSVLQTKTEEYKSGDILEEKQSMEDKFEDDVEEHQLTTKELVFQKDQNPYTPKPRSPIIEEESNTPQVNFKETIQPSVEVDIDVNTAEEAEKDTYNYELVKSEKPSTKINLNLNLENAEEALIQDDNESCLSRTCSPIPDERSYTPQSSPQIESIRSKVNLSTKTKAAYKAYDLQNLAYDLQACQTWQNYDDSFEEIANDYKTMEPVAITVNQSSLLASISSENQKKLAHVAENSDIVASSITANQSSLLAPIGAENEINLDQEAEKHAIVDDVKASSITANQSSLLAPICSENEINLDQEAEKQAIVDDVKASSITANQSLLLAPICSENESQKHAITTDDIPNEVKEIKTLELNFDKTVMKVANVACEETKSKSFALENISFDNIEGSILITDNSEVLQNETGSGEDKNNVGGNISPLETNQTVFTKDSSFEEKIADNSKNSFSVKCVETHTTQTNDSGQDNLKNSSPLLEVTDQSVITESKSLNIYSESEKPNNIECLKSSTSKSLSPVNNSEVTSTDSAFDESEAANKALEHLESIDVVIEDTPKNVIEEPKVSEILQNINEKIIHRPGISNENSCQEEHFEIEERDNKPTEIDEEDLEKSSALALIYYANQISKAINEGEIAEVPLEETKTISTDLDPRPETNTDDIQKSLIEKRDELASEDIKLKLMPIQESEEKHSKESSTLSDKSNQKSKMGQPLEQANTDDYLEKAIEEKELIPESSKETEERDFKENSVTCMQNDLISEELDLTKEISLEENNEASNDEENKTEEEYNFNISPVSIDGLGSVSELNMFKIESSKEESHEVLKQEISVEEGKEESKEEENKTEKENSFNASPVSIDDLSFISELNPSTTKFSKEESNEVLKQEISVEEGKKESKEEENKTEKENSFNACQVSIDDLSFISELNPSKTKSSKEESNEVLKQEISLEEGKKESKEEEDKTEEENSFNASPVSIDDLSFISELNPSKTKSSKEESNEVLKQDISVEKGKEESKEEENKTEEENSFNASPVSIDDLSLIAELNLSKIESSIEESNGVLKQDITVEEDKEESKEEENKTEEENNFNASPVSIDDLSKEESNEVLKQDINVEEGKEESKGEENKTEEENNFNASPVSIDDLDFISKLNPSKIESSRGESTEALKQEGIDKPILTSSTIEFGGSNSTLNRSSKRTYKEENNKDTKIDEKDLSIKPEPTDVTKQEESCVLSNERQSLFDSQDIPKDGAKEDVNDEIIGKGDLSEISEPTEVTKQGELKENCMLTNEGKSLFDVQNIPKAFVNVDVNDEVIAEEEITSAAAKREIETKDNDLEKNLLSNNELDSTSDVRPPAKEIKEIGSGTTNEVDKVSTVISNTKVKLDKETDQDESLLQEAKVQTLEVVFQQEESLDEVINVEHKNKSVELDVEHMSQFATSNLSRDENKHAEISDNEEKPENSEDLPEHDKQPLSQNDKEVQRASEKLAFEPQKENANRTSNGKTLNKACITPDDLSADFYGFKNQSSFEDESEDFHGFEDLEEVARIRQEIENLNDDSAANDGFLNNLTLNRALHKTSTSSLTDSATSEINEMEALEKELSQHQLEMEVTDEDKETEKEYQIKTIKVVSTNDIEHIKQMLESDEEPQNDGENILENKLEMALTSKDKSVGNINISNDLIKSVSSVIPKLSDLCRAALNSSLSSSNNLAQQQTETSAILVERELSVEEALAEMYRQAGVLLSDTEDYDNDAPMSDDTEAHDVLLINLQEILNSDNNDVYVLQCDMNENVLNVVQPSEEHVEEESLQTGGANTERVNTVQIILDTQTAEPQIHIISSDSESEVIILSDDESEIGYGEFKAREENVTIPFINDEEINIGDDNIFDISTIHHEEIVPDNLAKFLRDEFYKYLHEKYVQRSISKYYHAHRVLKKYKRRFLRRQRNLF